MTLGRRDVYGANLDFPRASFKSHLSVERSGKKLAFRSGKGGTRMLLTLSYWPNQGRNWRASRTEPKPQLTNKQWLLVAICFL